MSLLLEILPRMALFLVVAVAAIPAVSQARMLLLGASAFYTAGAFASLAFGKAAADLGTLSLLLGGVAGAFSALVLALLCTRIRGDYFALATLCFGELLRLLLLVSPPFIGPQGIPGVARGTAAGLSLESPTAMAIAALVLLAAAAASTITLVRAPWGAALQAIRDNEDAARACGLSPTVLRRSALVYAGFWAGLAGALSVRHLSLADPGTFALSDSVLVLAVLILAGRPSVINAIVIGTAVCGLAELLRLVTTGAVREVFFGIMLFVAALALRSEFQATEGRGDRP